MQLGPTGETQSKGWEGGTQMPAATPPLHLKGLLAVRLSDLFDEMAQQNSTCVIVMWDDSANRTTVFGSRTQHSAPGAMADILETAADNLRKREAREEAEEAKPKLQLVR